MMPAAIRELQEWDANRFVKYAALPYCMLGKYDFESPHIVEDIMNDFKVTEDLCIERIEQVKRKLLSGNQLKFFSVN